MSRPYWIHKSRSIQAYSTEFELEIQGSKFKAKLTKYLVNMKVIFTVRYHDIIYKQETSMVSVIDLDRKARKLYLININTQKLTLLSFEYDGHRK